MLFLRLIDKTTRKTKTLKNKKINYFSERFVTIRNDLNEMPFVSKRLSEFVNLTFICSSIVPFSAIRTPKNIPCLLKVNDMLWLKNSACCYYVL